MQLAVSSVVCQRAAATLLAPATIGQVGGGGGSSRSGLAVIRLRAAPAPAPGPRCARMQHSTSSTPADAGHTHSRSTASQTNDELEASDSDLADRPRAPPPPSPPRASASVSASGALDRSIQRQLFSSKAQMRARGVLERMQRMRSRVVLLGRSAAAAAGATAQAGAPASPVPRAHPHAGSPALGLEEAVQNVFHSSLVSRLGVRMGPSRSRTVLMRWRRIVARLLSLGGSSTGNSVRLYSDGTAAWPAMWDAISRAQRTIHLETYTLEPDGVGRKTMRLLAEAARRGVQVQLCYDSFGSSNLIHTRKDIDQLIEAGAHVVHFNPIWHIFLREAWRGSLWFRNHRKILIVDGVVGFCGGMNVSSDYYGKQEETEAGEEAENGGGAPVGSSGSTAASAAEYVGGTGKFRDTHLRVEGPAVQHLELVSRDTLQEASHVLQAEWAAKALREAEEHDRVEERRRRMPRWYPVRSAQLVAAIAHQDQVRARTHAQGEEEEDHALTALREQLLCPVPPTSISVPSSAAEPSTAADPSSSTSPSSSSSSSDPGLCSAQDAHDLFVQVLPSNVWRNMRLIQRAMLLTIQQAKHRICITNPYFIPPPSLLRALQSAALRGVQVQVVMAGPADVPVTRWASQHIYHSLLVRGVQIFELQSQVLHAKTVVIDGIYASIGSFNWDRLSARRNLEVNLTILDVDVAQQMEAHFEADLQNSKPVTVQSLKKRNAAQRLLHRLSYWILKGL